ncbi:MAG: serine/threonine-protein kinase [Myxococcota bacterium]
MDADARPQPEGVPFGRYLIRRRLARGGMGEVFLADQLGPLGPVRPVALKRMLPKVARDRSAAEMFLGEMETAARLNHPNIATTYDFGEIDGIYFLAMEYVEGLSLRQVLEVTGPLPVRSALEIVMAVADALEHAHGRKDAEGTPAPVVHRDVSPHNIMVSVGGAVKLLDFGIARTEAATLGGRLEGKMAYAAPEQLAGAPADRRSDLWALGVVLYEALTLLRPFESGLPLEIIERASRDAWVRLAAVRPEAALLDPIVGRSLSFDPGRRWPSAEAFRAACADVLYRLGPGGTDTLSALIAQAGGPKKPTQGVDTTMMRQPEPTSTGYVEAASVTPAIPRQDPPSVDNAATLPIVPNARRSQPAPAPRPRQNRGLLWGAWIALAMTSAAATVALFPKKEPPQVVPIQAAAPAEETPTSTAAIVAITPEPAPPPPESPSPTRVAEVVVEPERTPVPRAPSPSPSGRRRRLGRQKEREKEPESTPITAAAPEGLGLLAVRTTPWSRVSLDGKDLGASPIGSAPVQSGPHTLELVAGEGGGMRRVELRIRPGALTKVFVDFASGATRVEPPP